MDMYKMYIEERIGGKVIKTEKGFIVYKIDFPVCFIEECFVLRGHRNEGHASFLANQVFEHCKDAGVKTVICYTDNNANGVQLSKHAIECFGFEQFEEKGPRCGYKLEVSEWARQ